jgi:hypothetical protein
MNPTSIVLRWYRQSTGAAIRGQYTAEEVLELLRPTDRSEPVTSDAFAVNDTGEEHRAERVEAVRQVATRPAAWLGELTKQQRQEIGDLADRLPSLLFHHAVGGEPCELVERFGGWSAWRYERALEVAGECIASHLNGVRLVA